MSARLRCTLPIPALVALGALFAPAASLAGPHAGGTLILHSPDIVTCLDGGGGSQAGIGLCELSAQLPLLDCASAVTNGTVTVFPEYLTVYAAFPATSSPRLYGVTFGISYDENAIILGAMEACGNFELPNLDWPDSGEGTAITFGTPQTDHLVPIYVFTAYEYYGLDVSFDLIEHPVQGASFADDSIPTILDDVADFGRFGFNNNPGYLPCPAAGDPVGACCIDPNCLCILATRQECNAEGGFYQGDDTVCDPNPCACIFGACCLPSGECVEALMIDCEEAGGTWFGENTVCTPTLCDPVPTLDSSWGRIKSNYR